jgi:cobalt-zinc-cadmium resistance protein CzcA
MGAAAAQIVRVLQGVPGAADVKAEQTSGSPTLDVRFDRAAIARYGLTVEEVADTVAAAMGGRDAGLLFEGDRRFEVTVRVPEGTRGSLDALAALPVLLPAEAGGHRGSVPLSSVAQFRFNEGLNQISRENGKRRVVIQANVRGRDVGSFVTDAQAKVDKVALPAGSYLEWGGQFQNLQDASRRLAIVVPLCFLAIFGLLYMALGGFARAAAVFLAIPLGLAGGVFTLALTGIAFSVSAAVGFICLAGVAVLNRDEADRPRDHRGDRREDAGSVDDRVRAGDRLRPDGARTRHRRRGAETVGNGGDRRPDRSHHPYPARPSCHRPRGARLG